MNKGAFVKGLVLGLLLGIAAETFGIYLASLDSRVTRMENFLIAVSHEGR